MPPLGSKFGREGVAYVGSVAIAEVIDWTYDDSCEIDKKQHKGSTTVSGKAGAIEGGGTITVNWDSTDTTGQGALATGETVTLNLYEGAQTESGRAKLSGSVIIQGIGTKSPNSGPNGRTFNYWGILTETTITP